MCRSWYSGVDLLEFHGQSKLFSHIYFLRFLGNHSSAAPEKKEEKKKKERRKRKHFSSQVNVRTLPSVEICFGQKKHAAKNGDFAKYLRNGLQVAPKKPSRK